MKKNLWLLGIVMLLATQLVSAANTTITGDNPFIYGQCPTDVFGFMLYFGMGLFILLILWFCKKLVRVPFLTILIGAGFIIWSTMGLWGCSMVFGVIGLAFGLGVILFEFITAVK